MSKFHDLTATLDELARIPCFAPSSPIYPQILDERLREEFGKAGIVIPADAGLMTLETARNLLKEIKPLHPTIPALALGDTEVWYYRDGRDLGMGYKWCKANGLLPNPKDLEKTHALLGRVVSKDPEELFEYLQGEHWGRGEETNAILFAKGLRHTSMSVGDIVVIDGRILMVDRFGFVDLTDDEGTTP